MEKNIVSKKAENKKTIHTLVEDIQQVLLEGVEISDEQAEEIGKRFGKMLQNRLAPRKEHVSQLRMSNIGTPCVRKLYLNVNDIGPKEPLTPDTYLKFLYGDLIEELMLFLVELSGHTVEGTQDEQEIAGIKGHRDCVIDGTVVDVKSASSFSYKKFKEGKLAEDDPFGYITQIQSYLEAGKDDPIVTNKDEAAFFVVDKVLGHFCLDFHKKQNYNWEKAYEIRKEIINGPDLPDRSFEPEPDGYVNPKTKEFIPNGNEKLGMFCSYCDRKHACHDNIRTFLSSRGPVYLTKVVKEPRMIEVDKEGNKIEKEE